MFCWSRVFQAERQVAKSEDQIEGWVREKGQSTNLALRRRIRKSTWSTTNAPHRRNLLKFGQVFFVIRVDPQYTLRFGELIKFFVCQRSGQDEPSDRVKKCEDVDC